MHRSAARPKPPPPPPGVSINTRVTSGRARLGTSISDVGRPADGRGIVRRTVAQRSAASGGETETNEKPSRNGRSRLASEPADVVDGTSAAPFRNDPFRPVSRRGLQRRRTADSLAPPNNSETSDFLSNNKSTRYFVFVDIVLFQVYDAYNITHL